MGDHFFFIPCLHRFWTLEARSPDHDGIGDAAWIRAEAERALVVARRLFPEVQFRLCEEPPASQTYERGSLNSEIRRMLELGTALRLDPPRDS
jgi:hypothetical protein